VELFVAYTAEVFFTDAAMCMNLIVFVQQSDILRYFLVIEIFYCANTIAFNMPAGNFRKGLTGLIELQNELLLEKG